MRNRNPIFSMPPQHTPPAGVEGVIPDYAELYRRAQHELIEVLMKVSELSGKVDTLISLATQYKNASNSQPAASLPADDPEVEALGHRIDDAIAVLQGTSTATPVPPAPSPVSDPNAPVV